MSQNLDSMLCEREEYKKAKHELVENKASKVQPVLVKEVEEEEKKVPSLGFLKKEE